ncbi:protein NYNRIN-like [Gossypium australe]|uniref:Protein NYNRIN-like n=1 Tax=Gossypium australe TaxID=47621 RepID=A0A5B6V092_9ROSI|nr:protein NYNRIN-like [Gossypium australe]
MGNGIRVVLVSPDKDHYLFTGKLYFDFTNNMAEYEACIIGIRATIECKIKVLEVYEDSALVIYQLKGELEMRDPKLINYRRLVLELIKEFDDIIFCYLPQDKNQMTNTLATLAFMEEEKDDHPWYHDISHYVKNCEYSEQATENNKRTLRRLANDFHVMTSPWPFSMWGMDAIGPISPKTSNGHRFIFVVIDYFTKWVEGASYANVTKSTVNKFLKKKLICRYGMPERITSKNALNLNSSTIAEVCSQFKIKHHNSSPYGPKMNGAMEAANKNIKKIVGKMTETYKDWHEKLPLA